MSTPTPQHRRTSAIGSLEVEHGVDFLAIRHLGEPPPIVRAALATLAVAYGVLVALVLPAFDVARRANALWIVGGALAIGALGAIVFLRTRSATLRLDAGGLSVDQGTPLRRTRVAIAWSELSGVGVEAIDERSARRGVALRLSRKAGAAAIDAMPGVGVAELSDVRRLVVETWRGAEAGGAGACGAGAGDADVVCDPPAIPVSFAAVRRQRNSRV